MINHELEKGVTESSRRISNQELREFGDNAPFVCLFSGGRCCQDLDVRLGALVSLHPSAQRHPLLNATPAPCGRGWFHIGKSAHGLCGRSFQNTLALDWQDQRLVYAW